MRARAGSTIGGLRHPAQTSKGATEASVESERFRLEAQGLQDLQPLGKDIAHAGENLPVLTGHACRDVLTRPVAHSPQAAPAIRGTGVSRMFGDDVGTRLLREQVGHGRSIRPKNPISNPGQKTADPRAPCPFAEPGE